MLKPLTVWVTTKCGKILRKTGVLDYLPCLLRNLYVDQKAIVRIRHGTMDWFKIGKGIQSCILSPCLFNFMLSTSCGMLGRKNYKLAESKEVLKSLFMHVKEKSKKADLKLNIQKNKFIIS